MATSNDVVEKVAFSQMQPATTIGNNAIIVGLVNSVNARFTAGQVANLVTKERLNIGKVQNLSPSEMPISDATQEALNEKLGVDDVIPLAQVEGLPTALDTKLDKTGSIAVTQVTGLEARLTAIETDPIPVARVEGFDTKTNEIIDGREDLKPQVVRGTMAW